MSLHDDLLREWCEENGVTICSNGNQTVFAAIRADCPMSAGSFSVGSDGSFIVGSERDWNVERGMSDTLLGAVTILVNNAGGLRSGKTLQQELVELAQRRLAK